MEKKKPSILVVDDVELNRAILCELFQEDFNMLEARNGKEALECIAAQGDTISMVLLDLIMPVMDGFEVLDRMSRAGMINQMPVIMITAESSEEAILRGYSLGVSDVITKPFNPDIVRRRVYNIIDLNNYKLHLENRVREQVVQLREQAGKLEKLNDYVIDTLSTVVEFRDLESGQHIKRMRGLTKIMLTAVAEEHQEYGLTREDIHVISRAAAMHDIGKIAIPDHILLKPGQLTRDEFEIMKTHTLRGCEILQSLNYVYDSEYFKYSYDICRYHHERWDGNGYPDGLVGSAIPIWAQVVALADVYDALTSPRVYKPAYSHETAVEMILNGECGAFNPQLIAIFRKVKDKLAAPPDEPEEQADICFPAQMKDGMGESTSPPVAERTLWLLEMEREKYRILTELTGEIIFSYDISRDSVDFSDRCQEEFGVEVSIENFSRFDEEQEFIYAEDKELLENAIMKTSPEQPACTLDIRCKTKSGRYEWYSVSFQAIFTVDGLQEKAACIGKMVNIHGQKTEREQLRLQAEVDGLTGLYNYTAAKRMINERLETGELNTGALIFFDLDDFKQVNDAYGHLAGNAVLRQVGERIQSGFRGTDIVARVGGDEFLAFLSDIDLKNPLLHKLDELTGLFDGVSIKEKMNLPISASIGVACYPDNGASYEELLLKADRALYTSKYAGKGRYTVYDTSLDNIREKSGLSQVEIVV